jgi:hypothetical protein
MLSRKVVNKWILDEGPIDDCCARGVFISDVPGSVSTWSPTVVQSSARARFSFTASRIRGTATKDNVRPWKTRSVKHERRRSAATLSKGRTVPRSIRGTAEYVRTGQNVFTTYYLDDDFVHDCFPHRRHCSAFFLLLEGAGASHHVVVDFR